MKSLAVIIFALTVVQYGHQQTVRPAKDTTETMNECIKESGVDQALVQSFYNDAKLTDDKNMKCYLKCILVEKGEMTEAGQIQPDKLKSNPIPGLTPAQTGQLVDACGKTTGTDPCDIAFNFAKCVIDETIKLTAGN